MHASAQRRISAAVATLLLAGALVVSAPTEGHAAGPWRFTKQTYGNTIGANSIGAVVGTCGSGYIPIAGGLASFAGGPGNFEIVSQRRTGERSFTIEVHNYDSVARFAGARLVCALASHVGTVTYMPGRFYRDSTTGIGRGTVGCPSNGKAVMGGAYWENGTGATRRIDLQHPTSPQGAWSASGWSPTGDILVVEAYCVTPTALGNATMAIQSTTYSNGGTVSAQLPCPSGTRPGGGGVEAIPAEGGPSANEFMANDWYSSPAYSQPTWDTTTAVMANVTLRRIVWCLPAGQPTITFSQVPANPTASSEATFTFTLGDTAGEPTASYSCNIDGNPTACNPAGTTVNGLGHGLHHFRVTATNSSFQTSFNEYSWRVDQIPPSLITPLTSPPVNGPIHVQFSERVVGVTDGLTFTEVGRSGPIAGTLADHDSPIEQLGAASFTPAKPLTPGARIDVAVADSIVDRAGNPTQARTERIRTILDVESTSPQIIQRWDPDTNTAANRGGYIESAARGSAVTWRFTADQGQSAVLYGVRRPDGGYARIYLDGVETKLASFYKSSTAWKAKIFESYALSAGQHTLTVQVEGTKPSASTGTWVALDAVGVGGSQRQETGAVQTFRRVEHASASGGSYEAVSHRTRGDTGGRPRYQLVFDGTGIKGFVTKTPGSGSAEIYVDGVKKSTVSLYASTVQHDVLGFALSGLAAGRHTLRVEPLGTGGGTKSMVTLDRLVVS